MLTTKNPDHKHVSIYFLASRWGSLRGNFRDILWRRAMRVRTVSVFFATVALLVSPAPAGSAIAQVVGGGSIYFALTLLST